MSDDIQDALSKIFAIDSALYQERGFQRRIGYGERPALLNIDLANAWTRPGNVFYCHNCHRAILMGKFFLFRIGWIEMQLLLRVGVDA